MAAKCKLWTKESMQAAVESIEEGKGLRQIARLYNVQVETIWRRANGSVSISCIPGPATILTNEEEDRLCKYIIQMADMGFGLTTEDIMSIAFKAEKSHHKHLLVMEWQV